MVLTCTCPVGDVHQSEPGHDGPCPVRRENLLKRVAHLERMLEDSEHDRDYYRGLYLEGEESKRQMTSAMASGAATAVAALERLQLYQPIVDAAVEWHDARQEFKRRFANGSATHADLHALTDRGDAARGRMLAAIASESHRRKNVS